MVLMIVYEEESVHKRCLWLSLEFPLDIIMDSIESLDDIALFLDNYLCIFELGRAKLSVAVRRNNLAAPAAFWSRSLVIP